MQAHLAVSKCPNPHACFAYTFPATHGYLSPVLFASASRLYVTRTWSGTASILSLDCLAHATPASTRPSGTPPSYVTTRAAGTTSEHAPCAGERQEAQGVEVLSHMTHLPSKMAWAEQRLCF